MSEFDYKDFYSLLNVSPEADDDAIRKAYRQAALHSHPDKPGGSTAAFLDVSRAFSVLSCPHARRTYESSRCCSSNGPFIVKKQRSPNSKPRSTKSSLKPDMSSSKHRPKTKWSSGKASSTKERLGFSLRVVKALQHLQDVLQDMDATTRASCIKQLPPHLRSSLLNFMERMQKRAKLQTSQPPAPAKFHQSSSPNLDEDNLSLSAGNCSPSSRLCGIRALSSNHYKAYMNIKALRMYTAGCQTLQEAVEQHTMLTRVRQALQSASVESSGFWESGPHVAKVCSQALDGLGTSAVELGLHVFVSLRAEEWLGRSVHITTAVMPLQKALETHARLLVARRTSWAALRAEWIHVMRSKKRALSAGLCLAEAEKIADNARSTFLKGALSQAVCRASKALQEEPKYKAEAYNKKAQRMEKSDSAKGMEVLCTLPSETFQAPSVALPHCTACF